MSDFFATFAGVASDKSDKSKNLFDYYGNAITAWGW